MDNNIHINPESIGGKKKMDNNIHINPESIGGKKKMDNNIHINPESIGKFKSISDVLVPEGYESPITGYINQLSHQIIEQRDNEVVAQINEQIGVNVDKNELIRALNYDRNQFNEGYRKGYRDATEKYEEANRWRKLSEEKPKVSGSYLVSGVWESGKEQVGDCEFKVEDGYFDACWNFNILAWKPLPEAYESEVEE